MKIINNTSKFEVTIFFIAILFSIKVNTAFSQVTDIDGKTYKTVKIGNQEWMAENLAVRHYRNGISIPEGSIDRYRWENNIEDGWCYYDCSSEYGKKYGMLYTAPAVLNSNGLAPEGWHIPSKEELQELINYLNNNFGDKLKAKDSWNNPKTEATDEYGFRALAGGFRSDNGEFYGIGKVGNFWLSNISSGLKYFILEAESSELFFDQAVRYVNHGCYAYSVRCIKDN